MKNTKKLIVASVFGLISIGLSGCGTTPTEKAASTGAVVGGLVDGWGGAAVGAILGAGIGYASETAEAKKTQAEAEKLEAQAKERQVAALENTSISNKPETAYRPKNNNPLTGSTWRVVSFADDSDQTPEISSMVISFPTNEKSTTLVLWADGRSESYSENYSVTGDALVFVGKGYVTNSKYSVSNNNMVLVADDIRVVLEEIEENI